MFILSYGFSQDSEEEKNTENQTKIEQEQIQQNKEAGQNKEEFESDDKTEEESKEEDLKSQDKTEKSSQEEDLDESDKNSKENKDKENKSEENSEEEKQNGEAEEAQSQEENAEPQEETIEEKLSAAVANSIKGLRYAGDQKLANFLETHKKNKNKSGKRSTKVVHKFRGGVTQIVNAGYKPLFFVAGNDGFVSRYSYPKLTADSWQFSSMPIKNIAVHPQGRLIAIYESDGFGIHQVSLWDWELKKNIFSKRLSDSVVSLSWSANGSYLFIGNRSVDGISVLDKKGRVQKIYKQAPGIVFLAATASSEKSIVTYGESGRLVYTGIKQKKKLKEFETESFLNSPNVIDKFKKLIGYKNRKVFVISALSGKVLKEYPAREAIFAAKLQDKKPIWIQRTNRRSQWCIRQGDASSQGFYIPDNSKITAARHIKNHMIIGTEDGSIYMLSLNVDSTVKLEAPLKYSFTDIDDLTTDGNELFALKNGDIYHLKSHKDKHEIIANAFRTNHFVYYKDGFILWSDHIRRLPIYYYSLKTEKLSRIAYPKSTIISLSTYKDSILFVESFHGVSVIDFKSGKLKFSYNAPGIQNAVQIDNKNIIIAKSSINKSQSPVFIINMKTQETLPISIQGKLAFSLKQNTSSSNKLNCFLLNTKKGIESTELLRIHLNRKDLSKSKFKAILSYKDEDMDAFLLADKYDILTNLGKGSIVYYNVLSKQTKRLRRSYSLSRKAIILKDYFVSLNYGGTISWYSRKSKELLRTHGIENKTEEK